MPEYKRTAAVNLMNSWVGKKEADGSYKEIIDIYNSYKGGMLYSWPWCACATSAVGIALGYQAIWPIEISCTRMIDVAKKLGIWVENDAHIPALGDLVLYDWEDNGVGDNLGNPDHVGMVTYVNKEAGYFVVTEGNCSDEVKKRTVSINGRYIRGFCAIKYTDSNNVGAVTQAQREPDKSVETIAREVISGLWGNGETRKKNLEAKGYDYATVQAQVNTILNGSAPTPTKASAKMPTESKVTATCKAYKFDKNLAGTYTTTEALYMRNDAGTNKKALVLIPKGVKVQCYGYYNEANKVVWPYIQVALDGVLYTGFSHSGYLKKV